MRDWFGSVRLVRQSGVEWSGVEWVKGKTAWSMREYCRLYECHFFKGNCVGRDSARLGDGVDGWMSIWLDSELGAIRVVLGMGGLHGPCGYMTSHLYGTVLYSTILYLPSTESAQLTVPHKNER